LKKLIVIRTATIVEEIPFNSDYYGDSSLSEAIRAEQEGPETGWGENFFENQTLTYNNYVTVINTESGIEGVKGND